MSDLNKVFLDLLTPRKKPEPIDSSMLPDYSRAGVFIYHNCHRCHDGQLPCIKGKGNERDCDTLHARND